MTYYSGYSYYGYNSYSYNKHGYNSYSYNNYYCKPKPAMQTYEVTAFKESDLVSGNLGCGSKFTMPAGATTCITISDDDAKMSGDTCRNENANDSRGQQASIEVNGQEVGNGGQVYIEKYHWLYGSNGCWYVLVEIEQEGSNEDFFTFYTGNGYTMPPAGIELTVHGACNSSGLNYANLGAGACAPAPVLKDDAAKTCEDDAVKIDVLANDTAGLTISEIDGMSISEGQTVTLANGVEVMLMGGQLQVSGANSAEVQALVPGQELTVSFMYEVQGGGTANVDVTFCGEYEDLAEFGASLPTSVCYTITDENNPAGSSSEAYTVSFSDAGGDARLEGVSFAAAYCLDVFLDDGTPEVDLCGELALLDDSSLSSKMGIPADQMDNIINYMLNQDYAGQGYTDAEVQGAIWGLMDNIFFVADGAGEAADSEAILADAKANGLDFEAQAGDIVGAVVTPDDSSYQRFVVGIEYTDCLC